MALTQIGNYVHLHWQNYETAGTYKLRTNWGQSQEGHTNFDQNIFNKHKGETLKKISQLQSANNLQSLENKINKQSEKNAEYFKKMLKNAQKDNNSEDFRVLSSVISSFNSNWGEKDLKSIINGASIGSNGLISYKGSSLQKGIKTTGIFKTYRPKSINQRYKIETLEKYLNQVRTEITNNIELNNTEKVRYQTIISNFIMDLINITRENDLINQSLQKVSSNTQNSQNRKGYINQSIGDIIIEKINEIRFEISSVGAINTILRTNSAEFFAQVALKKGADIALQSVRDTITRSLEKTMIGKQQSTRINTTLSFPEFNYNLTQKSPKKHIDLRSNDGKNKIQAWFDEIGDSRFQKTDAIVYDQNVGYNISIKTTNLNKTNTNALKEDYGLPFKIPHITLQESSLLLYLMGAEAEFQDWALGNHYLNVLSHHGDQTSKYSSMRKQANQALRLYILYSAMTGLGQLRGANSAASILAIQDTSSKNGTKIHLINMSEILQKLSYQPQGAILYPEIESISFQNKRIGKQKPSLKNANERISQLLINARSQQVSAQVKTTFLNQIIKG